MSVSKTLDVMNRCIELLLSCMNKIHDGMSNMLDRIEVLEEKTKAEKSKCK